MCQPAHLLKQISKIVVVEINNFSDKKPYKAKLEALAH
jgi:hypothetical protein